MLRQFTAPLVLVLLGAALVTRLLGEWVDAIVILIVVLVNALVGFFQESKAATALEALMDLVTVRLEAPARPAIITRRLAPTTARMGTRSAGTLAGDGARHQMTGQASRGEASQLAGRLQARQPTTASESPVSGSTKPPITALKAGSASCCRAAATRYTV